MVADTHMSSFVGQCVLLANFDIHIRYTFVQHLDSEEIARAAKAGGYDESVWWIWSAYET